MLLSLLSICLYTDPKNFILYFFKVFIIFYEFYKLAQFFGIYEKGKENGKENQVNGLVPSPQTNASRTGGPLCLVAQILKASACWPNPWPSSATMAQPTDAAWPHP
jgi:hypothetical protein